MPREHVAEHAPSARYLGTWIGLLALTTLSLGLSFVRTGAWEIPIALLIAVAKSTLVLLFFMHLVEQKRIHAFVLVVASSLVVLLLSIVSADVLTRRTFPATPLPEVLPGPPRILPPPPGGAAAPPP